MNGDKLDDRLRNEIEERRRRGIDIENTLILVEIIHVRPSAPPLGLSRTATISAMEEDFDSAHTELLSVLGGMGVSSIQKLLLSNSVATELTISQIREVEVLDSVERIVLVKRDNVECMNTSAQIISAPESWTSLGVTGAGIKVAVLDSGIDKNHPALLGKVSVEESIVTTEGVNVPGGHGTHVAGTIASQAPIYRGIAPGATLINIKVLEASGNSKQTWVIDGMQRAYVLGANVVNLSLGWSHISHKWQCPDGNCSLCRAAQTLVDLGVVVIVAAGNEDNERVSPFPNVDTSLRCPGQCRGVITVGAVQKNLLMAAFSSLGPPSYSTEPWITKPDLCAPGVSITSATLGNGWTALGGTSMAAPHVAGVAALMLEKNPQLSPQMVKSILTHTAIRLPFDRYACGAGLINAYSAILHS